MIPRDVREHIITLQRQMSQMVNNLSKVFNPSIPSEIKYMREEL